MGLSEGLSMMQIDNLLFHAATEYYDANKLYKDDRDRYFKQFDLILDSAYMDLASEMYNENKQLRIMIAKEGYGYGYYLVTMYLRVVSKGVIMSL